MWINSVTFYLKEMCFYQAMIKNTCFLLSKLLKSDFMSVLFLLIKFLFLIFMCYSVKSRAYKYEKVDLNILRC